MSLDQWRENGWLHLHEPSPKETAELLEVADRALADARVEGLTADARVALAYPAVLALGAAALAASGYRAGRDRHHERIIDSLSHTAGIESRAVGRFHRYRRLRNEMMYERVGRLSDREADQFLSYVEELRTAIVAWLRATHPRVMSPD
jgi:hypothetical protein